MTEPGTEKHLVELSKRVDFGFEQTSQRLGRVEDDLRSLRSEVNGRFDKTDDRFDKTDDRFDRTDDRLNAGFERVDGEFVAVRSEMKAGFDAVNLRFDAMNLRFDAMQRQLTRFFAGTLGSIIAGAVVTFLMSHS